MVKNVSSSSASNLLSAKIQTIRIMDDFRKFDAIFREDGRSDFESIADAINDFLQYVGVTPSNYPQFLENHTDFKTIKIIKVNAFPFLLVYGQLAKLILTMTTFLIMRRNLYILQKSVFPNMVGTACLKLSGRVVHLYFWNEFNTLHMMPLPIKY